VGADIDARNDAGSTPLHLASAEGRAAATAALAAAKAPIDAADANQWTPLMHAAMNGTLCLVALSLFVWSDDEYE
jgi:ankyrin repeat protein